MKLQNRFSIIIALSHNSSVCTQVPSVCVCVLNAENQSLYAKLISGLSSILTDCVIVLLLLVGITYTRALVARFNIIIRRRNYSLITHSYRLDQTFTIVARVVYTIYIIYQTICLFTTIKNFFVCMNNNIIYNNYIYETDSFPQRNCPLPAARAVPLANYTWGYVAAREPLACAVCASLWRWPRFGVPLWLNTISSSSCTYIIFGLARSNIVLYVPETKRKKKL